MTLVEKVLEFEKQVSNDIPEFVIDKINNLKTEEDIRNYYLYERGWEEDEDLVDTLDFFLSNMKIAFVYL